MIGRSVKATTVTIAAALLALTSAAQAEPVQAVHSLAVENSAAFLGSLDTLFESDDLADLKVSVWAASYDGSSPTTHVIVEEFTDYDDHDRKTAARVGSDDWPRFVVSSNHTYSNTGSALHVQRLVDGSGWRNHGAAAVFVMSITDPGTYVDAFNEMVGAVDNPGSVRLMEARAGGMGVTHLAIITGESMASVNEYIDELFASRAYRTFAGKVSDIRKIRTVSLYRRIRTYGD
jgi:hypothetical protein